MDLAAPRECNPGAIQTAANNVDKIPGAYTVKVNAQTIVDNLPTEQAINTAKQNVQSGLAQVPSFDGAGYSVKQDGTKTAYIDGGAEYRAVTS